MPTIGAVMPAFNQAKFIVEAIDSIRSQVDTLVVVDDGSTDNTEAILTERYGEPLVRTKFVENRGTAAAINVGIERLREIGEFDWLTWVSSDNVHYDYWREKLLSEAKDDVGAIYAAFDARGECRPHRSFRAYTPSVLGESINCYFGPNFIIRSEVWQEHRGLNSHDYDNWCRVEEECWRRKLRIVGIDEALCMYRVHPGQATRRRGGFDAHRWLAECKKRRAATGITGPIG